MRASEISGGMQRKTKTRRAHLQSFLRLLLLTLLGNLPTTHGFLRLHLLLLIVVQYDHFSLMLLPLRASSDEERPVDFSEGAPASIDVGVGGSGSLERQGDSICEHRSCKKAGGRNPSVSMQLKNEWVCIYSLVQVTVRRVCERKRRKISSRKLGEE